ncbi:MAG: S-layer protein [Candidatus Aenigmarchaeota archaeon]|nr:S-layer protein [Candidatus Aenigmarchaeota archaeon]
MYAVEKTSRGLATAPIKPVKNIGLSKLAIRILRHLVVTPDHPRNIAKKFGEHEQKIYYHVRQLDKMGFIEIESKKYLGGTVANVYKSSSSGFVLMIDKLDRSINIPTEDKFFSDFIKNGKLNSLIIIGSSDPHGPEKARSRDALYASNFSLFLGKFLSVSEPNVVFDTDLHKSELKNNLIIIGGPVVNRVTKLLNKDLCVKFAERNYIYSKKTKRLYKENNIGFILKQKNPLSEEHEIMVIAGKGYTGTRAAVLAFFQAFDEISRKNYTIVEGIDNDADGIIDSVKIVE